MKKNIISIVSCTAAALLLGACSLQRTPNDPNTYLEFDQDAVFTKVYQTFAVPGQSGPNGDSDIDGIDGGTSAFYRMTWELNEFPSDEGWWIWGDPGVADVRIMNWDSSNDLVKGLYYRYLIDITLCNHFLDKTEGKTDEKTLTQRAEVRLVRAINYYYLLDMFGQVPFLEHVTSEIPTAKTRKQLYDWLEAELLELESDLPATRISLYRTDKVAAQLMLARLYLNAEVYTGTAQWDKAAEYAATVMKSGYTLYTTPTDYTADGGYYYSAYQKLFMGDNNSNGAQNEAILMIYQDGNFCQAWGGARFLVNCFRDANWVPNGSTDSWSCFRSSPELIENFVDLTTAATLKAHEYDMPALIGDDRAIFVSYYQYGVDTTKTPNEPLVHEWNLKGEKAAEMYDCWGGCKWTGIHSTAKTPADYVGIDPEWPDNDIPFLRVAEAYLTYAEAVYRGGKAVNGSAEDAIKALRDRANNTTPFTIDDDFLLAEWSREFWFEGRRRIDLVRFGQFAGNGVTKNWEGRGGAKSGEAVKNMDKKYNIFPIPESDVVANPNLAGINEANGY